MREIKFRGYSKELNKWFVGALDNSLNWADFIIVHENGFGIKNRVDSETIGQITGLKDNVTGKEIYEGDIVQGYENGIKKGIDEIIFLNGCFNLKNTPSNLIEWLVNWGEKQIEVIGNIHENPELLTKHKN